MIMEKKPIIAGTKCRKSFSLEIEVKINKKISVSPNFILDIGTARTGLFLSHNDKKNNVYSFLLVQINDGYFYLENLHQAFFHGSIDVNLL